jgi:hypothetical protein
MPSYKYNGMIPDDDPRYQEGITIMIGLGLNEKSKQKSKKIRKRLLRGQVVYGRILNYD